MHEAFEGLFTEYITRSLNVADRVHFEAHLANCNQCRRALAEWEQIAAVVRLEAHRRASSLPPLRHDLFRDKELATMTTLPLQKPFPRMRTQSHLRVWAALALLVLSAVFLLNIPNPERGMVAVQISTPTPTSAPVSETSRVPLIIARRSIENGAVIRAEDLTLISVSEAVAPFTASIDLNAVIGKIARGNIACGQIILDAFLADNARDVPSTQVEPLSEDCTHLESFQASNENNVADDTLSLEIVDVVIVTTHIQAGDFITPERLGIRAYPAQLAPVGAFTSVEEVNGMIALTDVYREQIVLPNSLGVGMPIGQVAISLPIETIRTVIDTIQPGDQVEIWGHFFYVDVDTDADPFALTATPGRSVDRFVENAEVIFVGSTSLTVAISPQDAIILGWTIEARLPLELRVP